MGATEDELVQHYDSVRRFLTSFPRNQTQSVDDLIQQTYVRAISYVRARGPPRNPGPWLIGIAKNLYYDQCQSRRAAPLTSEAPSEQIKEDATSPLEDAASADTCSYLYRASVSLQPSDRSILRRYYLHGQTCEQIGTQLGIDRKLVKGRLFRARRRLRSAVDLDQL